MDPYYIQPGTPVYFKYTTFSNLPSTCTGYLTFHSALTYDDTPEAVTPAPLPTPPISFDELISQGR